MLHRVALVRTDISEERSASLIRVKIIGDPSLPILVTLMKNALISSETSVLTRAIRRNIPEDAILQRLWRKWTRQIFLLISYFGYTSTMKMVVICCSKIPGFLSTAKY
jgi:hypothetical protein